MLNDALRENLESRTKSKIINVQTVSGGDINEAFCLHTSTGKFFLKLNSRSKFPLMFQREQEGLEAIKATNTIAVPDVLLQDYQDDDSYLLLQWIERGEVTHNASQALGIQLADMHRHTAANFGFENDNYMGSLPQNNKWHSNWADFYIHERLLPMVSLAASAGQLSNSDLAAFERLYGRLPHLYPTEQPALVHGDLWGGNYMIDEKGKPYLIDTAVSYSNREFDIAMTTLFGGFGSAFYDAYQHSFPLQPGWRERLSLWNLYPLLLHVNLFGGSYLQQVRNILSRFL